jgi:hypothetical protein
LKSSKRGLDGEEGPLAVDAFQPPDTSILEDEI